MDSSNGRAQMSARMASQRGAGGASMGRASEAEQPGAPGPAAAPLTFQSPPSASSQIPVSRPPGMAPNVRHATLSSHRLAEIDAAGVTGGLAAHVAPPASQPAPALPLALPPSSQLPMQQLLSPSRAKQHATPRSPSSGLGGSSPRGSSPRGSPGDEFLSHIPVDILDDFLAMEEVDAPALLRAGGAHAGSRSLP